MSFDELLRPGTIKNSRLSIINGKKRFRVASAEIPEDDSIFVLGFANSPTPDIEALSIAYKAPKRDLFTGIIQDAFGSHMHSLNQFIVDF